MSPEQGLWSIITSVLRAAPARTKIFVTLMPVLLIVLTASVVTDLVGSNQPTASVQVWSLILGNAGLLLWSLAAVLHAASESKSRRPATASTANELFRRIWESSLQFTAKLHGEGQVRQLHNIVLVLPIISVTAGVLLAAATGILLPSVTGSPLLLLPIFMYAIFVAMAVRTVSDTVRFLFRFAREQTQVAAEAQGHATQAQLSALQAQLNPHFLFNALNTVAALVQSNPSAAEATVDNLAQVLRRTLDRSRRTMSTLEDEVDYLKAYLSVEKERFGDRLTVDWSIDPRTRTLRIPPMTLQPLVENSLKHGIGGRLHGGTIVIRSALQNGSLVLEVADDGAGFLPLFKEGTGLRNLRERLDALYGGDSDLRVETDGEGAAVRVTIPVNGRPTE